MKTDAHRQDAYDAGVAPTTVGLKVAARLTGMKSSFASVIADLVPIEQATQNILNGLAYPTRYYPYYYNFAREIWAAEQKGIDGDALVAVAQSLHDKYEAYGLTSAGLIAIADEVFNITVT